MRESGITSRYNGQIRRVIAASLPLLVLSACVTVKVPALRPAAEEGGRLVMVYGGGPSVPQETESEFEEHWMTVHVTLSDSTYEFGHIPPTGGFDIYCAAREGRFRIQGGETRHFAIRDVEDASAIFPLEEFGTYELTGPAMNPARAIFPRMQEPYYSIAILSFAVSTADTVNVELVASSPNGFSRADLTQYGVEESVP